MIKDEAIENIKSTIKTQGSNCDSNCRLCINTISVQYCLLNKEHLHWYYNEVTQKDILERTETCKALFKED